MSFINELLREGYSREQIHCTGWLATSDTLKTIESLGKSNCSSMHRFRNGNDFVLILDIRSMALLWRTGHKIHHELAIDIGTQSDRGKFVNLCKNSFFHIVTFHVSRTLSAFSDKPFGGAMN
jgi:hypothetical protein